MIEKIEDIAWSRVGKKIEDYLRQFWTLYSSMNEIIMNKNKNYANLPSACLNSSLGLQASTSQKSKYENP